MQHPLTERTRGAIGLSIATLALVPRLLFAMQMDQSFHQYLGWQLAHGGLPYVASFDQNFPGGAAIYALAILLFGTSAVGFAIFDLLAQVLACWLIARLAKQFDESGMASMLAPVIYAFTYIGLGVWDTGQRDGFAAPLLVFFALQVLLADRGNRPDVRWLLAGFALGAMLLVRPMLVLAGLPALWIVFSNEKTDRWRNGYRLVLGSVAPPFIVLIIYFAAGHLRELFEATILFNLQVYSKYRMGVSLRGSGVMTYVFVAGLLLLLFRRSNRHAIGFLFALAFVAPISTFIQGQGDAHHIIPTYAIASVLAAIGLSTIAQRSTIAATAIALVIIALGASRLPFDLMTRWVRGDSLEAIYAHEQRGEMNLRDELAAGKYLAAHTNAQDHIQIFSMRIWPYVLSGRAASSRFQSDEHLLMQPFDSIPITDMQRAWRTEFLNDLHTKAPKYILVTTDDHIWTLPHGEPSEVQMKRFPEFDSLVRSQYALDTVIGSYKLYRRS